MKKIFTTKISLQSSNPTFSYPIIRLPRELKELAGRIANIYQTEIHGVEGFFFALQLDNLDKFVEDTDHDDQELCKTPTNQSKRKSKAESEIPIESYSKPNTCPALLPDTPIGSRPRGPKRVRGRRLSMR